MYLINHNTMKMPNSLTKLWLEKTQINLTLTLNKNTWKGYVFDVSILLRFICLIRLGLSCYDPFPFLLPKTFELLGLSILGLYAYLMKKCSKIPKGQSKAVNPCRDKTKGNIRMTNQNNDLQTTFEQHEFLSDTYHAHYMIFT